MINPDVVFDLQIRRQIDGENGKFACEWVIPASLPYFDGHFPDGPILPGVGILDASLAAIRRATKDSSIRLSGVKNAKFLSLIRPGMKVSISLERSEEHWSVEWRAGSASSELLVDLDLHTRRG